MMSLGKLKRLAFQKNDGKVRREFQPLAKLDELAQVSQEMQDMRNCYDSLLSAAAGTANSAYEFSEALREMGDCLLEKKELFNDEESGKVLLMLAKVQFELHKLVDHYRSHIILTISNPSESLLNELRTVEEMKQQCDEKRILYEYMVQQREKAHSKSVKGEDCTMQQLQTAHDEYEEEVTHCVFRLKSLKQGQSRSLLTQAARHHAAQLNLFSNAVKSLEAIDPHVKLVSEKHRIDFQVSGLNDGDDDEDDGENKYDPKEHGRLSFDEQPNKPGFEVVSSSMNTMELDQDDQSFPKVSMAERAGVSLDKFQGQSQSVESEPRVSSHSAPIIAEKKFEPADRIRQSRPPTHRFPAYVLPTPVDAKSSTLRTTSVPWTRPTDLKGQSSSLWHSSPLENKVHKRDSKDNLSASISQLQSVYNDGNSNEASTNLLPPADRHSFSPNDTLDASDHKKIKRQAFSGPLRSEPQLMKPGLFASGPIVSLEHQKLATGSSSQASIHQRLSSQASIHQLPSSAKLSPSISSSSVSPPKISELHELPRPPSTAATKSGRPSGSIQYSSPLVSKNTKVSVTNKNSAVDSNAASPLPTPPLSIARSFSIPSRNQRETSLHFSKPLELPQLAEKADGITSPPLTPISLAK